jgi:hypothetical protein
VPPDPSDLAPSDRLHELAALLAAGVRRLRDRAALPANTGSEKREKTNPNELATPADKSVTVTAG